MKNTKKVNKNKHEDLSITVPKTRKHFYSSVGQFSAPLGNSRVSGEWIRRWLNPDGNILTCVPFAPSAFALQEVRVFFRPSRTMKAPDSVQALYSCLFGGSMSTIESSRHAQTAARRLGKREDMCDDDNVKLVRTTWKKRGRGREM